MGPFQGPALNSEYMSSSILLLRKSFQNCIKLQFPQSLDLSLVWSQYVNPELPDLEVYALHTELLFIVKYESENITSAP